MASRVSVRKWLACVAAAVLLTAFVAAVRVYSLSLTYTAVTALAMLTLTAIGIGLGEDSASPARMGGLALVIAGLLVSLAIGHAAMWVSVIGGVGIIIGLVTASILWRRRRTRLQAEQAEQAQGQQPPRS